MRLIAIALLAVLAGSCSLATDEDPQEVVNPVEMERGFMGLPLPPDCIDYYNNGHHKAWAKCMGVPYMDKGYEE